VQGSFGNIGQKIEIPTALRAKLMISRKSFVWFVEVLNRFS